MGENSATKMIWSEECIDPTAGFDIQPDGSAKPKKLGFYVMTDEEAEECLRKRGLW